MVSVLKGVLSKHASTPRNPKLKTLTNHQEYEAMRSTRVNEATDEETHSLPVFPTGAAGIGLEPSYGAPALLSGSTQGSLSSGSIADAAALVSGSQWTAHDASGKTSITYSFATAGSLFAGASAQFSGSTGEFSAQDKVTTRALLNSISMVANVAFVEVADSGEQSGQIRYAYSQEPNRLGYAGYAFFPSEAASGGDVWIGAAQAASQWDFYRPELILHETLHAVGLKHPFEGTYQLDAETNIIPNTVMSYSPVAGTTSGSLSMYPVEPMPLDVQALQNLYGVVSHNPGDTIYDLAGASFTTNFRSVWDSAGNDTLDASRLGNSVKLDLNEGARSDIGVRISSYAVFNGTPAYGVYESTLALANGAAVENAVGSRFNDLLKGNQLDNILTGGAGDDRIDGGAGLDTATFAGTVANFKIEQVRDMVHVTDRKSGQGTDMLSGIEKLRFEDVSVDLTAKDTAATVAEAQLRTVVELYVGFFNRMPEANGLNFWLNQMNKEMTTVMIADAFYYAALEYPRLTGYSSSMTNDDFVGIIYRNVLGRSTPDAEGLEYWSRALADGIETRGSLLKAILTSAHTFHGNSEYGWVADLLVNKYEVGKMLAVDMGLSWNTAEQSITKGMEIAAAVTPTNTDVALQLIGVPMENLSISFAVVDQQ